MKNKLLKILFGICLFIFIGINCIKGVSIDVIKEAFIGRAFSFRINDVIWEACPQMDIDTAIELQEMMQEHQQLDRIIHRYLCAYSDYLKGDVGVLQKIDNESAFGRMNQEILRETKKLNPSENMTISDDEFLTEVRLAEEEVETILRDEVPGHLQNFGELAILAINMYALFTSIGVQLILLLIMLSLIIYILIKASDDKKVVLNSFGKIFVIHGCFWAIIVSGLIRILDRSLLSIVDRIMGRAMMIDCSPFVHNGAGLIVIGVVFILLSGLNCLKLTSKDSLTAVRMD